MILEEGCNIVVSHYSPRFAVTWYLVTATLLESSSFLNFEQCLPAKAAITFPSLGEMKHHSELSVI